MVSCRKAVPQAPSLGRFDVLLLSFEVEKCGLCFLFVGEKYGEIDKKLMCVCVCVCVCACLRACPYECVAQIKKKKKAEYLSGGASSSWEKVGCILQSEAPPPFLPPPDFDTPS